MVSSQAIAERILALPAFAKARKVLFYAATATEPETREIFQLTLKAESRPQILFPRIVPGADMQLEVLPIQQWEDLRPGSFNILEPDPAICKVDTPDGIELILIPGLAFDRNGSRLGRGSGYYDRLLAKLPAEAIRVGCFFACQEFPELPRQPHDMPLHWIITEKETIQIPPS
jgi:5-formyltetrahydrofolate cyclo-ligase